ncbi:CBS domain-containing protein [bacterium]|nr:CBS domain-containing protein [bacterium]
MQAKDIMTKKVLTVPPEMSIPEVASFLLKHRISGAPVINKEGKLIGIVTEDDLIFQDKKIHFPTVINILGGLIYLENFKHFDDELKKVMAQSVLEIMTKEVVTVREDTSISEIATLMTEKQIHLFPVMNQDIIVGIVGKADIVKAIAEGVNNKK